MRALNAASDDSAAPRSRRASAVTSSMVRGASPNDSGAGSTRGSVMEILVPEREEIEPVVGSVADLLLQPLGKPPCLLGKRGVASVARKHHTLAELLEADAVAVALVRAGHRVQRATD